MGLIRTVDFSTYGMVFQRVREVMYSIFAYNGAKKNSFRMSASYSYFPNHVSTSHLRKK